MGVMDLRRQIMNSAHIASGQGNPVSFSTDIKGLMKQVKASFSPIQSGSGDPSPTNVRSISGWTGVTVYRTGTNVFDEEYEDGGINNQGGNNTYSGVIRSKNYIPVVPGMKYYIWYTRTSSSSANLHLFRYGKDKTFISHAWTIPGAITFEDDVYYVRFQMDSTYTAATKRDVSINFPYTDTSYHAYSGTTIPITFPALGKNQFNINATNENPDNTNAMNTSKRKFKAGTYCLGASWSNWFNAGNVSLTSISDGVMTFSSVSGYGIGFALKLKPGVTYAVSRTVTSSAPLAVSVAFYASDGTYLSGSNAIATTFTVPDDADITVVVFSKNGNVEGDVVVKDIQIEEGSTPSAYEEYKGNTVYGGYVDLTAGELVVTHISVDFSKYSGLGYGAGNGSVWYFTQSYNPPLKPCNSGDDIADAYCDKLKVNAYSGFSYTNANDMQIALDTTGKVRFRYNALSGNDDREAMYAVLADVTFIAPLATPITYPLTPQQITTLIGDNVLWSDANGNLNIKYWKH